MRIFNTSMLLLLLLAPAGAVAQDGESPPDARTPEELFEQANAFFSRGQYAEAVPLYRAVLERAGHSAAVHFNLGSAYARQEAYGLAVLHFERARAMDPADGEIRANLEQVHELARMRPPERSALLAFSELAHPNTWTLLGTVAFWGMLGLLCIPPWVGKRRRPFYGLAAGALCVCVLSALAVAPKWDLTRRGVVVESAAPLKVAPTESSPLLRELPEGAVLVFSRKDRGHYYVMDDRRQSGWVETSAFIPIVE